MNREELINKVLNKKIKDYTFPVVFFLIFSIFVFFAIRPNLVTAFSLQRQLDELRLQDEQYETIILNIVNYQSLIEQTREDFIVLEQAVPNSPEIFSMVEEIRNAATQSGMIVNSMDVSDVALRGTITDTGAVGNTANIATSNTIVQQKKYIVKFQALSSFNEMRNFLTRLATQRRLKVVNAMNITTATREGSQSATFNISFVVEGFYL